MSDTDLLRAYGATTWRVATAGGPVELRLGAPTVLRSLAILTAYNPRSELRAREPNEAANARLAADIVRAGGSAAPALALGTGDDADAWTEPGFAVSGLDLASVVALGVRYGQNAIVWVDEAGRAGLVVTRSGFCGYDVGHRLDAGTTATLYPTP